MKQMCGLDWISATFPDTEQEKSQTHIWDVEGVGVECRAMNGYTLAHRLASGCILMQAPDDVRLGSHVIMSAAAIENYSSMYEISQDVILHAMLGAGRLSRLDVRLDVYGWKAPFLKMYQQHKGGKTETRATKASFTESALSGSEKGAATVYIGSTKKRTKLLRVYDKGMQNHTHDLISRFELECRGQSATNAGKRLKRANFGDYGAIIKGMLKNFCQWPGIPKLVELFSDSTPIPISTPQHVRGNTAKWLLDCVAPTLARETILDTALLTEFMIRVRDELKAQGAME
jgi:hypothetical protein